MGFNPRSPKVGGTSLITDPTLPEPDGSQPLHFPTATNPPMAKLQDWIQWLYLSFGQDAIAAVNANTNGPYTVGVGTKVVIVNAAGGGGLELQPVVAGAMSANPIVIFVVRDTADGNEVQINIPVANTRATFNGNGTGWVAMQWNAGAATWRPVAWGGDVRTTDPVVLEADALEVDVLTLTSRSVSRRQQSAPSSKFTDPDGFDWIIITDGTWEAKSITAPAPRLIIPLLLPNGATIEEVTVYINPPPHGADWPPDNAPTFDLRSQTSDGTTAVLGTVADSLAVQADYELHHAITLSGLNVVVDATDTIYFVVLAAENGAAPNAKVGTFYRGCTVTYAVTAYDY